HFFLVAGFERERVVARFQRKAFFLAYKVRIGCVVFIQLNQVRPLDPPGTPGSADEVAVCLFVYRDGKILLGKYARHALVARIMLPSPQERTRSITNGMEGNQHYGNADESRCERPVPDKAIRKSHYCIHATKIRNGRDT